MESVLMHICQKTNHDFDKHSLEFTDKSIVLELDKTWDHYVKEHKVTEVVLVNNGAKAYSTMCVSQGDTDVMLLRLIDGRMQVMAGTPEMLIERLTDENEKDMSYHDILILTFRSFMNPAEFFDCLLARFFCELPQNPSPEDVEYFTKMKVPTQKRVLKTLMWWTEHHWHDFGLNTELRLDLAEFSTSLETAEKGTFLTESRELKFIINQQVYTYEDMVGYYKSVERKGKTMESMLQEITPEDLAQQLCLHDFRLFKYIHPIEVLNQIWKKEADGGSPSLEFFIERFDKESYWVATEIVNVKDFKKRVNALKTFVLAAKACQEMHNFYSMFALIAGLNLTPVQRLKKTWEALPPPAKKAFQDLEKIADPSRNMKNYRDQLTECKPPIVPFLPIYMKDLTFMNDGNESKVRGMINFDKLRMMANRVKDISALAAKEYKFEPNPAVLNYLAKPPIEKSMSKLKALSAECEK
ncbi:ras guanine nucleotide exchange factor domain-containing protein [Cladochytrium replicatum]|nr:ras guanine nucleotide exchange factor domain-containing protein [Cladochytrium replicatum]